MQREREGIGWVGGVHTSGATPPLDFLFGAISMVLLVDDVDRVGEGREGRLGRTWRALGGGCRLRSRDGGCMGLVGYGRLQSGRIGT